MDRKYFDLIDKATDIAILATALARNANYSKECSDISDSYLEGLIKAASNLNLELLKAVHRQTRNEQWDEIYDPNRYNGIS